MFSTMLLCYKIKVYGQFCFSFYYYHCYLHSFLQDSFVGGAGNGQPSRETDIEMGQVPRSNSDMGMEAFNKQVHNVHAF